MQPQQPKAFDPAQDLAPLGNEVILVVGCGRNPTTHLGQPHRIPLGDQVYVDIQINGAYTIDIDRAKNPHRVGSFWIADHTEDLPGDRFQYVFFENLPEDLFGDRGLCLTAARAAHRLLAPGGVVIIRSGMSKMKPGSDLHQALRDIFGPLRVGHNVDRYNFVLDIRAMK